MLRGSNTGQSVPYYLDSTGDGAHDLYSAGTLRRDRVQHGGADHYVYDPNDDALAKIEEQSDPSNLRDMQPFHVNSAKVVYVSAPFAADAEVSGFFRFDAYIAIDQPDTDFAVSIFEIAADGSVTPLSSDVMRARYRESPRTPKLVTSREPQRYEFNRFAFASRLVSKGSRIVLALQAVNSIEYERNYNSGGVVADETRKVGRAVKVTLVHDSAHPSALYVPFGDKEQ